MRYLGIDYGQKRTGLAICDAGEVIASPLKVLTVSQDCLVAGIAEIVRRENADAIVLGLPLNMDGTVGYQAKRVRAFAAQMKVEAQGKLAGVELTRKKKKKRLDAVAAASILQSFLDEKHGR